MRPLSILTVAAFIGAATATHAEDKDAPPPSDIVVTASRADLLGVAATASQGTVTRKEIELRPIFRAGQLYESIPGLVVTVHSGEGKAPQYLIRGYNLDHGTDFANFVDGMPVNRPTNTHGQGYSDLNFLIPQVVQGIDYTKGPYFAAIGDFGSVASAHTRVADNIPTQATLTTGTDGYQQLYGGTTYTMRDDARLLAAVSLTHYDGPWNPDQNFRKVNGVLRYGRGDATDGFSVTGMAYAGKGRLITDQPLRAIQDGTIGRYGTLDPTDASRSQRYSLSANLATPVADGTVALNLYAIRSTMTLWNDFTHYLDDPVNGDQEQQGESRWTLGGAVAWTAKRAVGAIETETVIGFQGRYDTALVDRRHTLGRTTVLPTCSVEQDDGPAVHVPAVGGYCNADRVHLLDLAPYLQTTVRWTPWLRTVAGLREEYYRATDRSLTTGTYGSGRQWLFQPKGGVVVGPWAKTELYVSAGRGFHSDDVRGTFGTLMQVDNPASAGRPPLLASTTGYEVGLRTDVVPRLSLQVAAFRQDFSSELTYNADVGQTEAGASSRRKGVEISGQYRPVRWLELNSDLAFSRPRYRRRALAAFGLAGPYIADAPSFIGSAGILVDGFGRWSGSLVWRRLGSLRLSDGDAQPKGRGYSEFNLEAGYALPRGWRLAVGLFNLFDSKDYAAEYYYASRLKGEPAEGVTGLQVHPLEPRAARFSVTKTL